MTPRGVFSGAQGGFFGGNSLSLGWEVWRLRPSDTKSTGCGLGDFVNPFSPLSSPDPRGAPFSLAFEGALLTLGTILGVILRERGEGDASIVFASKSYA